MALSKSKRIRCLVCTAGVGQLVPFCEWCGAKHTHSEGRLILTGAICQNCGFQTDMPFARCPRCHAQRRILCPRCGIELAVRQACSRCGLHYRFFDQLRRERIGPAAMHSQPATRKLALLGLIIALALTLAPEPRPHRFELLAGGALAAAMLALIAWRSDTDRTEGGPQRDLYPVLETYDPAGAAAARALLKHLAIDSMAITMRPGEPPMRRILVAARDLGAARACLAEHGIDATEVADQSADRPKLRLVVTSARNRQKAADHD